MSGGHWNYKQGWLDWELAEDLEHIVKNNKSEELDNWGYPKGRQYPPEVLERFVEAAHMAKKLSHMVHCIDYLLCSDYGEDSFLEEWDKRINEVNKKRK